MKNEKLITIPIVIITFLIVYIGVNVGDKANSIILYSAPLPLTIAALKWKAEIPFAAATIIALVIALLTITRQITPSMGISLAILILPIPIITASKIRQYKKKNINYRLNIEKNITYIIPIIIPLNSIIAVLTGELNQQQISALISDIPPASEMEREVLTILSQTIDYISQNPLVFVALVNAITTIFAHLNFRIAIAIVKKNEPNQKWNKFANINANPIMIIILAISAMLTKTNDPIAIMAAIIVGIITGTIIITGIANIHKKLQNNHNKRPILIIVYSTLATFPIIVVPVIFAIGLVNAAFAKNTFLKNINKN